MAEGLANMVIGNLSASVSEKVKLLKNVDSEAQKLKYDVESLQSFLQLQSSSRSDGVSTTCVKRAREAVYDAEDVLDDYQLHFADEKSGGGGVLGLVRKRARGIEIASEIHDVRGKIREIKIPEIRRRGKDSNTLNGSNTNQDSDPRLDALFVEESELVGIDGPRNRLIQILSGGEESLVTISVVGMGGLGKTTLVKKMFEQAKRGGLDPSLQFKTFAWIAVSQTYKATNLLEKMIAEFYKIKRRDMDAVGEMDLIMMLRSYLENKTFLLVLDDMWDIDAWKSVKRALLDRKNRSRVIITTRSGDVAKFCSDEIFDLQPLQESDGRSLFCRRAFRHFQETFPFNSTSGVRVPAGIGKLKSLQKLANIEAENGIVVAELESLTELRRLCIIKLRKEDGNHLCNSVARMRHLQALNVTAVDENGLLNVQSLSLPPLSLQRLYFHGRLENVPHWIHSLHNLVLLRLAWCKLKDDPLKGLQSLPSLVVLQLINAYDGEELCCGGAGGYPKLKLLNLRDLKGLKQVKVENGAMPNLVHFMVENCKQLENVPLGLQHIPTLKYLVVSGFPDQFEQSLNKEGGKELVDCVRHIRRHIWINYPYIQET